MNAMTMGVCAGLVCLLALVGGCSTRERGTARDAGIETDLGALPDMSDTPDVGTPPDLGAPVCDAAALTSGTSHFYVVNLLSLAAPEGDSPPFSSAGFDIDGDEVVACNAHLVGETAEFAGQAPDFGAGVDNALGGDLGNLVNVNLQATVDSGAMLLLVELRGVDSLANDSCVGLTVYPGALPVGTALPAVGGDGHLAPGQTFDSSPAILVDDSARIVAGRLESTPGDFPLAIDLLGASVPLNIHDSQFRFDVSDTSISLGVIGGSLKTAEVMAAVELIPSLAAYVDVVRDTLTGLADIDDDGSPDSCEAGSISLKVDGVTATRGRVLGP